MFLSTTGDVLDAQGQAALRRYVRRGGGFVGVHSAADTEDGWPWYGTLLGARFLTHPPIQPATVRVVDRSHPSTRRLPALWQRTDEWYDYVASPRGRVRVLATLDETTYSGGRMGTDHPIAWCRAVGSGRVLVHRRRPHDRELRRAAVPQPPARRDPLGHPAALVGALASAWRGANVNGRARGPAEQRA